MDTKSVSKLLAGSVGMSVILILIASVYASLQPKHMKQREGFMDCASSATCSL